MSVKKTLTLPWLEFVKLEGVSSMPLHEQQGLFKKLSDPNYEMPWGQYKNLPHIVNLSLNEQTARYKTYLIELEEIRQQQLALLNGAVQAARSNTITSTGKLRLVK